MISCWPISVPAASTFSPMSVHTGTTPQYSDSRRAISSRSVVAKIGARGRSADSRRAVPPPRVTATIACASPRFGEHHRRLAERLRVVVRPGRRQRDAERPIGGVALGFADDGVERLHRARGKGADRRFGRQHDRVDAVVDGAGGVVHLGARRARLHRHRFQHLRGHDDGNALMAARAA